MTKNPPSALVALLGMLAVGCATDRDAGPDPSGARPNLLFIVSDTLRADAVDCDRERERTPNLCSLADRGVLFEKAYSGGPWTLPSSVALFTGNHATSYGQLPQGSAAGWTDRDEFFHIADEEVLLADALVERGYEALRFNESKLPATTNAFQGMEYPTLDRDRLAAALYRDYPPASEWQGLRLTTQDFGVLGYLAARPDKPFFLLHWIVDPHAPYLASREAQRTLTEELEGLDELRYEVPFYAELGHLNKPEEGLHDLRTHSPYSDTEEELLLGLYHAEVRQVDMRIGYFLELLRERGLEEQTLVVVTSDHGEGFGEHGRYLHGNSFHEELLRVPLLMAGPGLPAGARVTARVPGIDVMPTLCDLMEAGCLEDTEGRTLRPLIEGEVEDTGRPLYATAPLRNALRDSVIDGDLKLIVSQRGVQLYDLAADPGEQMDLAAERPDDVARLRELLRDLRRRNERRRRANQALIPDEGREETKEGTMEQLRALGYVD